MKPTIYILAAMFFASTPGICACLKNSEQAVIVTFIFKSPSMDAHYLTEEIQSAVSVNKVATYDEGNPVYNHSTGEEKIYLYGPNADKIAKTIKPILLGRPYTRNAKVTKRYGPPNAGMCEVSTSPIAM